jgi:hypothetical protein
MWFNEVIFKTSRLKLENTTKYCYYKSRMNICPPIPFDGDGSPPKKS